MRAKESLTNPTREPAERARCFSTRPTALVFACLLAFMAGPPASGEDKAPPAPAPPGAELFAVGPLLRIQLNLDQAAVDSLRKDHRKDVKATVICGGVTCRDVSAHIKGSAGSLREVDDRPAWTLGFSKNIRQQRFHGLEKIHLNNSVQDPGLLDEVLCGDLFRAAGVPSARASRVLVELNGHDQGLYVLKEGFTKDFLGQYFFDTSGNLYDGGFVAEIGPDTQKSSGHGPDDRSDLKRLLAACEEPDPGKRLARLNKVLDVDRFITMMALEVLTVHWDGYSLKKNNYRIYVNPADGRAVFIVHGMDQMFGRDGDLKSDILPEFDGIVANRLMEIPEAKARYLARLRALFERHFNQSLLDRVDVLAGPVRAALAKDKDALSEYNHHVTDLKKRITIRIASVRKQLNRL